MVKEANTELVGSLTSTYEELSNPAMINHWKDHNYILKECPRTKQLELDIEKLKGEKTLLKKEVTDLKGQLSFYKKQNIRIKSVKWKLSETIADLKEEIKAAKGPRYIYCDICDDKFKSRDVYDVHVSSAHNVKEVKCETCNLFFSKNQHLNTHIASVHEGKKPYQCDICVTSFKTEDNLDEHILSVHEGKKPVQCGDCVEGFSTLILLKKHLTSDHRERKLPCSKCGKSFMKIQNLKNHVQIVHEGKKLFPCKLCDKSCKGSWYLKRHMEIFHEGKKPFQCDYCGFRTSAKQKLTIHIEGTHEGKKHYCSYCDKGYTQRGTLISHMRLHTGRGFEESNKSDFKAENDQIFKRRQKSHENDSKSFGCIVSNSDIDLINKEIYSNLFDVSDIKKMNEEDGDFKDELKNREMQKRKYAKRTPSNT